MNTNNTHSASPAQPAAAAAAAAAASSEPQVMDRLELPPAKSTPAPAPHPHSAADRGHGGDREGDGEGNSYHEETTGHSPALSAASLTTSPYSVATASPSSGSVTDSPTRPENEEKQHHPHHHPHHHHHHHHHHHSSIAPPSAPSSSSSSPKVIHLDGETLSPHTLVEIGAGYGAHSQEHAFDLEHSEHISHHLRHHESENNHHHHHHQSQSDNDHSHSEGGAAKVVVVELTPEAWARIEASRAVVQNRLESGDVVYGVNTGFGNFADTVIQPSQLSELQENLIRSHASGVGPALSLKNTRQLMALRLNVLAKGHSGICPQTVQKMLDALNANCLPYIPSQGTVGASGDLAPLSHLALGLMGEGRMWDPTHARWAEAAEVLQSHNLTPISLGPKEGLALINGTQFITAVGVSAAVRAEHVAKQATIVAALTHEVLRGNPSPFHPALHEARPHPGQAEVARMFRKLLAPDSQLSELAVEAQETGKRKVQDSYTLRCIPQVHGPVLDTVKHCLHTLHTECNSATDNPMVFAELQPGDKDWTRDSTASHKEQTGGEIISGGNFHGASPAKACDYLAVAVQDLATISERRIERLINPTLSNLKPFLVPEGGLNSGFMIAHCTAAALTSENKVLVHPASSDSIPTSAAQEDHVSMGGFAARKALQVVQNVETVIAIELLCACQALDLLRPLKTTRLLEQVHALVRREVPFWAKDRFMGPDIERAVQLIRHGLLDDF